MPRNDAPSRTPLSYEASEDIPSNPHVEGSLGDVINTRFGSREVIGGALAVGAMSALVTSYAGVLARPAAAAAGSRFGFREIEAGVDETHHVAEGHDANVLIRWGDPVLADAPPFDPENQTPQAQEKQFGYNNDYIGYFPLPAGSRNGGHGLLVVNHEFTNRELMGPAFLGDSRRAVDNNMAAHGASVIEVRAGTGGWRVVERSAYARRISALSTKMRLSGPAAGHPRLRTRADPTGTRVIGTMNNCAGGMTPWGTVLIAEENFHGYFTGDLEGNPERRNHERYGVGDGYYNWARHYDRFDVSKEPNEANRFGWMVEFDPYDARSTPVKRTAMGRFKHEGAETIVNADGRLVCYMGDDQRFDYLYKFVSDGRVDPNNRAANADLLDNGTLFVARFEPDGTLTWMPLVFGSGPLTPANDFHSPADVLIETRRAADLLGATPMDRPEDVQPDPLSSKVYVMLTNNSKRGDPGQPGVNAANPRAPNPHGHIIEMVPPDGNHAALTFAWDILVKCGKPGDPEAEAMWHPKTSEHGWFTHPDNAAVDGRGRLWIATDGNRPGSHSDRCDGLWAVETAGGMRGLSKHFFRAPVGSELCGPQFTPDDGALFVAVQHPADAGVENWEPFGRNSTFEDPATRWPDFREDMPPRPSVVVITRRDGGRVGG